ncbi:MAG: hypothetical protein J0L72_01985 [Armatimonadetes bacterium]|nr:hypothetical protein [Armatimonadota bacterium]
MPAVITLLRTQFKDDVELESSGGFQELERLSKSVEGSHRPTVWKRVTGAGYLTMTLFDSVEAAQQFQTTLTCSPGFEQMVQGLAEVPDFDEFEVLLTKGIAPEDVPINGYCSVNSLVPEPGHAQEELVEARYVLESLFQIEGFLGAFVGRSMVAVERLDSVAFWRDGEAAEKAIPIRVNTNLRLYRRVL